MSDDTHRFCSTWAAKAPAGEDQAAMDRMAAVVADAMTAVDGEDPQIGIRLTVLRRVQAMLLAALCMDEKGSDLVTEFCESYAGALAADVRDFRKAFARDLKRVARNG
jgi:hypothetical protein